jgi:ABC-type glutathione transport system ATPase component
LNCFISGDKLLYAIEKHGVIIVVGQTGCGKTTRKRVVFEMSLVLTMAQNYRNISWNLAGHRMATLLLALSPVVLPPPQLLGELRLKLALSLETR